MSQKMFATPIAFQATPRTATLKIHSGAYLNSKIIRSADDLFEKNENRKLFSKINNSSDDDSNSIISDKFKGVFARLPFVEEMEETGYDMNSDFLLNNTKTTKLIGEPTDKFTFAQKIESSKSAVIGLFVGGIAVSPFNFVHDVLFKGATISNGFAQFEFDTDMGSIMAALFAIVYRYCVRKGEEQNEMLPMGVIGAFVLVRTLSRVRVSYICKAVPLQCGAPIGYFDWDMLGQVCFSGLESVALFGSVAYALEYCYKKKIITRLRS